MIMHNTLLEELARQDEREREKVLAFADSNDAIRLVNVMQKYGGDFASNLAKAWQHADSHNRHRLMLAFQDLLESYRNFL